MNRAVFLLLVLCGCARDEAIQATLQLAPELSASCVVLEVLSPDDTVRQSEFLPRPKDREKMVWAVYRKDLPADVRLQARAFWGSGCEEPRAYNGRSEPVVVHFAPGVQNVQLTLFPPGEAEDADRDGFVAAELGGADCDDRQPQRRPGIQELCDASTDLNCDGRRGCDDATCAGRLCSRAATSLVFVPAELNTKAGQCTPVTVERRDSLGTAARLGYATPIALQSMLTSGVTLHPDPGCLTSFSRTPVIPANSSGLVFYVRSTLLGTNSLSVTSAEFPPVTAAHNLLPGPATMFAFTSPGTTSRAGECSPISLAWRDAYGHPSPGSLTAFTSTPARDQPEEGLFADAECTQPLKPTTLAPAPALSFYFRGTRAVTSTFTARSNASVSAQQEIRSVKAVEASKLVLSPENQTLLAGQCSQTVTVRVADRYGNPSPLPAGRSLTFDTPLEVYAGAGCGGSRMPTVFDPRGVAEIPVSFKTKTGGNVDLALSGESVLGVRQSQVIIPTVRRGSCQMANGEREKSCSIFPAGVNPSRAFVVFQATTDNDTPGSSFVRCGLKSSAVECRRNDGVGIARIDWQVVELLQGLFVQHLEVPCDQSIPNLPSAINTASSFVLFSSSQSGAVVDRNDFVSVRLTGSRQLQATMNGSCNAGQINNFQVVQFTNSQVQRGVTGAMNGKSLTVDSLPAADLSRSILLSTWQVGTDDSAIRKRLVRGSINPADPTQLVFSRGAGAELNTNDIPQISWERITFPDGTLVQTQLMTVNEGETRPAATYSLGIEVDPTRTLVLTSSQVGGQGGGETTFEANDILGVATGSVLFIPYNQLSVTRGSAQGTSRWTSYAIQFDP